MKLSDYHLHSCYSFDSDQAMEPVCKRAVELGVGKICFTDHVEFGVKDASVPDFVKREEEIGTLREKYRGRLEILSGVEIGQAYADTESCAALLERNEFDLVISSVHTVMGSIRPSKFDFTRENYIKCFEKYFDDLNILAEKTEYDVVAHVTFPFRYVPDELLREYPIKMWENRFKEVFKTVVNRNRVIEINTSGYRTKLKDAMPSFEVLNWYKECGGTKVRVGSDGHSINSAFSYLEEGYLLAKIAGLEVID